MLLRKLVDKMPITTAEQYFDKYSWSKQFRCAYKPASAMRELKWCIYVELGWSRCAVKVRNQGQHTLAGIIIMGKPPLTGEREWQWCELVIRLSTAALLSYSPPFCTQIQKCKYTNTKTQIQKHKYTNTGERMTGWEPGNAFQPQLFSLLHSSYTSQSSGIDSTQVQVQLLRWWERT